MFLVLLFTINEIKYTPGQQNYLWIFIPLVIFCIVSSSISFLMGVNPDLSRIIQLAGTTIAFLTVPRFIKNNKSIEFLLIGLTIGGILCFIMILANFNLEMYESQTYQNVKAGLSPTTWNANTMGTLAIIWVVLAWWGAKRIFQSDFLKQFARVSAIILALIPFVMLTRTAAFTLLIIILYMMLAQHKNIFLILFIIIFSLSIWSFYSVKLPDAFKEALSDANIDKGSSVSSRAFLRHTAFQGLLDHPFGIGFGNEVQYFKKELGHGMTHNIFLSAYLELGVLGGTLFLISILFWPWKFARITRITSLACHARYFLVLSLSLAFIGLFMPGFFFEKPGIHVHIVFFGVLGLMERNEIAPCY